MAHSAHVSFASISIERIARGLELVFGNQQSEVLLQTRFRIGKFSNCQIEQRNILWLVSEIMDSDLASTQDRSHACQGHSLCFPHILNNCSISCCRIKNSCIGSGQHAKYQRWWSFCLIKQFLLVYLVYHCLSWVSCSLFHFSNFRGTV